MSIPEERYVDITRPGETSGGANSGEVRDLKRRLDQHIGSGGQAHAVATETSAGFMSSDDKQKLNGVQNEATKNMPDDYLLARGNHTGVQAIETINGLRQELNELGGAELEELVDRAEAAANLAETASNNAFVNANLYETIAEGLDPVDGVPEGEQFQVLSADGESYKRYRHDAGGVAFPLPGMYPSAELVSRQSLRISAAIGASEEAFDYQTYGSTTPNTATVSASAWSWGGGPVEEAGILSSVSFRLDAAGTGAICIYSPSEVEASVELVSKIPVTAVAGVNTVHLDIPVLPGYFIQYQTITGGRLRNTITDGTTPFWYVQTVPEVGESAELSVSGARDLSLSYTIAITESLKGQIDYNEQSTDLALGFEPSATNIEILGSVSGPFNTLFATSGFIGCGPVVPNRGFVRKASINLLVSGSIPRAGKAAICHLRKNSDSTHSLARVITVFGLSDGANEIDLTDYGLFVEKGDYVGALTRGTSTNRQRLGESGSASGTGFFGDDGVHVIGEVSQEFTTNYDFKFSYELEFSTKDINSRIAALEVAISPIKSEDVRGPVSLVSERFAGTDSPAGWSLTAGWSVSDGLSASGSGGWGVTALSPGYSAQANRHYRAVVEIGDTASVFGICTAPIESNSGSAVAMVDGTDNTLKIYSWDGSATAGTAWASVALPGPLVVGRKVAIDVEKNGYIATVQFTDLTTLETVETSYSGSSGYTQFHGRAGLIFISGGVKFHQFSGDALYPRICKTIIIGDSNAEKSATIAPNETWAFQLAAMSDDHSVIVSARSGDETPSYLTRQGLDLDIWKPAYVVIALGTNDSSHAVWRTNMTAIIEAAVGLGAEPILVTQIPRTGGQATRNAMNADIRSGYFGAYRYIDHASAVSLNNDGETWNPTYNSGDGVHANPAGQTRMLQQALADAPFIV